MSWLRYLILMSGLTLIFAICLAFLASLLLGIRDNYYRYCQKAELQWTGAGARPPRKRLKLAWLMAAAILSAWVVMRFL